MHSTYCLRCVQTRNPHVISVCVCKFVLLFMVCTFIVHLLCACEIWQINAWNFDTCPIEYRSGDFTKKKKNNSVSFAFQCLEHDEKHPQPKFGVNRFMGAWDMAAWTGPIYTHFNGLIRYSCSHISGHHEPIHVKFGVWGLRSWTCWNAKKKIWWRHTSVLYMHSTLQASSIRSKSQHMCIGLVLFHCLVIDLWFWSFVKGHWTSITSIFLYLVLNKTL